MVFPDSEVLLVFRTNDNQIHVGYYSKLRQRFESMVWGAVATNSVIGWHYAEELYDERECDDCDN